MPRVPIQQLPEEEDDWEDEFLEELTEKTRKKSATKRPKPSEWLDDARPNGRSHRGKKTTE